MKLTCYLIPLILVFASCQSPQKEQDLTQYWNTTLIDSSFSLLYKYEDTTAALHYFDSSLHTLNQSAIYPKATRFTIIANYHYFFTHNNQTTAATIDSALSLYNTPALQNQYPRTYVGLLLFGGNIAYRLSQYSKANDYYFRAKKLADAHLTPCEKTSFNYSISMVLYRQQNFKEALHYFKEAYNLQSTCSPQTTAIILQQQEIQSNIGLCFLKLKRYDSALTHFNNALTIANGNKDSLGLKTMDKIYGVIYGHQARVAAAQNKLDEARQLALKSIALNDRPGYETNHATGIRLQLADIYSRQQDLNSMHTILANIAPSLNNKDNGYLLPEFHRLKASYFEKTKQTDSALQSLKTYHTLTDSIAQLQEQLTAADVDRQIENKEHERQIITLTADKKITTTWLWVTMIFSAMTLMIISLIYQNYRRNKKTHKLITEAVIQAQENERSLIGLELHDNINQVLTTVKLHNEMLLQGIGDPQTILPRSVTYLQDCITEIRSLSKRLSAPTLGKISLEDSVNDLIESINSTSKVKITHHIAGLDNQSLQQDLHIGLYRILQEQLNNILKHAEASEVVVKLERINGSICLLISDNGKGFSKQNGTKGIGLMNMQTRAENLNGTFEMKSKPGQGCTLEVTLPVNGVTERSS